MARKGLLSCEYVAEAGPLEGTWLQLILFLSFTAFLAAAFFILTVIPAQAVGAHGPFNSGTEKCEKCHAMHTGATQSLLEKKSVMELCQSCHSGGAGADTAVMQGYLMKAATPGGTDYIVTGNLLGGGFDTLNSASPTSKHRIGEVGAPFGTTETGPAVELTCTSCHTPHEGPNYRLLRRWVDGRRRTIWLPGTGRKFYRTGHRISYMPSKTWIPRRPVFRNIRTTTRRECRPGARAAIQGI
jgi:predicted CXXCH cytochrome family protein